VPPLSAVAAGRAPTATSSWPS